MTIVISPTWRIIAYGRADWCLAKRRADSGKWQPQGKLIRQTADDLGKLPATIGGKCSPQVWRIEAAERHDPNKPARKPGLRHAGFHLIAAANEREPRHVGVYGTIEEAIGGAVYDIAAARPEKID